MTVEQWGRVKELFEAAVERDSRDRASFLAAACGQDAVLRDEVERLLKAHDEATAFIDRSPVAGLASAATKAVPPAPAVVIGRYEVGRLLGAGGMGHVYAARDVELGRAVAIKFGHDTDADAHARLRREAQHASRLNHPNICTIHEVGTYPGGAAFEKSNNAQPFIVMELVDGQPLSELVRAGGLPIKEAVRYGIQIADALAHAHRNGVTHRDLKSANVLVTPDRRAKVLDFGLARTLSRETVKDLSQSRESSTGEALVAGTLSVLAPEILRGEKADERSDIWALGVLLHEMASGQRPFRGATGFELSGAILHAQPSPLPKRVPASFKAVVQRCLEKDPRNRYQNAGDVHAALAAVNANSTGAGARRISSLVANYRLPIVLVTILLAFASYHFIVRRDAAPIAVGESGRPAIAVMHFQHAGAQNSDTAWLSSGVPNMLMTGLAQTRGLEIVSERRLLQALGQNGTTPLASLGREEAADVARRAGAGAIVVGTIYRSGAEIRIDAQVEDLASGRVLAAETVRGTDVFALVDQLASEIRDVVGFGDAPDVRVANVSSTSLEAYRLYSEGTRAAANVRMVDADKLLKAAVAIDPSFAEAHLWLAHVSGALGRRIEREQYVKLALANADRLSERHRLLLDIEVAHQRGDRATARRVLDDALAKFPDLEEAYPLALQLYHMGHVAGPERERLIEITAAGAAALPSSSHTRNAYGYALLAGGRYAEAAREFEAYARIAPREPNPHDSLGEAYLKMGDAEKAVDAYTRALAVDPTFAPSRSLRAWSLAVLGRFDAALAEPIEYRHLSAMMLSRVGRYREAAEVLAEAERQAAARGDHTRAGGLRLVGALLAIERGDHARVQRDMPVIDKAMTAQPADVQRNLSVLKHFVSGLARIQAGDLRQAEEELESQGRIYQGVNELERAWRGSLEGEIALARGNLEQASTAFSSIIPTMRIFDALALMPSVLFNGLPSRDGLARVAIARGDRDAAISIYRALLRYGPQSKWVAPFEPLYVLQIARLLDNKGDRAGAVDEYKRFLSFWKNADADLPELAEARRAVARLS